VVPVREEHPVAEQELAVGHRSDAEVQVVAAQVLHRHLVPAAVLLPGRAHSSRCQQQEGEGLGESHGEKSG